MLNEQKNIINNYYYIFKYCIIGLSFMAGAANAANIFSDNFESGNLNAWSATYGTLSVSTQTAVSGTHSVESSMVGPRYQRGAKHEFILSRIEFYTKPNIR